MCVGEGEGPDGRPAKVAEVGAAAECRTQADTTVSSALGDLGDIEGPVGGPVKGAVTLSQANIKVSLPLSAFNSDMVA